MTGAGFQDTLIAPLAKAQLEAAHALLLEALGSYYSAGDLEERLQDPKVRVLSVSQGAQLLGVGVARIVSFAEVPKLYAAFGPGPTFRLCLSQVGSIEAMAVAPAHRGQGVAHPLITQLARWLYRTGCVRIAAVAWIPQGGGGSEEILQSARFEYLGEAQMAQVAPGRRCPFCEGACTCLARLYARMLTAEVIERWEGRRMG